MRKLPAIGVLWIQKCMKVLVLCVCPEWHLCTPNPLTGTQDWLGCSKSHLSTILSVLGWFWLMRQFQKCIWIWVFAKVKKWPSLHREGGGKERKEIKVLHMTLKFACVHDLVLGKTFLSNFFLKNASLSLFWGCRQSFWAFYPKMYKSIGLMCLPQMTLMYPKSANWDLGLVRLVYTSM